MLRSYQVHLLTDKTDQSALICRRLKFKCFSLVLFPKQFASVFKKLRLQLEYRAISTPMKAVAWCNWVGLYLQLVEG